MQSSNSFNAAGVLPYCMLDGEKYYLLGRDRFSSTLSDFGGKRNQKIEPPESPHDCAARECAEELGALGDVPTVLKLLKDTTITTQYTITRKKTGKKKPFIYHLFTVKVQPDLFSDFQQTTEKCSVIWIKATNVYYSILAQKGIVTIGGEQVLLRDAFQIEMSALPEYGEFSRRLLTHAQQIKPFVPTRIY